MECLGEGDRWLTDGPAVAMHSLSSPNDDVDWNGISVEWHGIAEGSQHVWTTQQYLDKTDNADIRRYSCDDIKSVRATEATPPRTRRSRVGRLHATRHWWHLTKPTETFTFVMYFFYFVYESFNSTQEKVETSLESYRWRCIGLSSKLSKTASYFSRPTCNCLAWMKWGVRYHCFTLSLMIMTAGMWQLLAVTSIDGRK